MRIAASDLFRLEGKKQIIPIEKAHRGSRSIFLIVVLMEYFWLVNERSVALHPPNNGRKRRISIMIIMVSPLGTGNIDSGTH